MFSIFSYLFPDTTGRSRVEGQREDSVGRRSTHRLAGVRVLLRVEAPVEGVDGVQRNGHRVVAAEELHWKKNKQKIVD